MRPHITVLAPARNEEPVAERLVAQFRDQDYDNWRLIVIANNCTDGTARVAREAAAGDARITVLEATFQDGVKADALNFALDYVVGDVVLELDSDNQVPPDLLSSIAAAFSDPAVMAVQTQIRAYNARDGLLAAFQDLEFLIYSEIWNRGRAALGLGSSIGGTGFAARTQILKELGGWTRDLVEDFEMHTRLVAHGIHVTYLPWAHVFDEKPVTWDALVTQRKRWIRGHLEITARRAGAREKLGWIDQFYLFSPVFVALAMSLFVMGYLSLVFPRILSGYSYFSPWFWLVSLGIMVLAVTVTVSRARSWRLLAVGPAVPALLHVPLDGCFLCVDVPGLLGEIEDGPRCGNQGRAALMARHRRLAIRENRCRRVDHSYPVDASPFRRAEGGALALRGPVLQAGRSMAVALADAAEARGIADGVVQGRVKNTNGGVISGADVYLTSGTGVTVRARTNSTGDFLFAGISAGSYLIEIQKSGYMSASTTFDMPADGGGMWVDATLSQGTGGVVVVPIPY